MFHRARHTRITVPNGGNAKLMRTRKIRPFRRSGGGYGIPGFPEYDDTLAFVFDPARGVYQGKDGNNIDFDTMFPTYGRNSTATYYDAQGNLQTAAANEPRLKSHVPYDGGWDSRGMLVENASENGFVHSTDLANVAWFKNPPTTVTPQGDGSFLLDFTGTTGVPGWSQSGVYSAQEVTFSIWIKPVNAPAGTVDLFAGNSGTSHRTRYNFETQVFNTDGGGIISTRSVVVGDWHYVQVTGDNTGNGGGKISTPGNTTTNTEQYLIKYPQLELGKVGTSYIPTEDVAVTRAADENLRIPAALVPWPTSSPSNITIFQDGDMTFADTDQNPEVVWFYRRSGDVAERLEVRMRTNLSDGTGRADVLQTSGGSAVTATTLTDFYGEGVYVAYDNVVLCTETDTAIAACGIMGSRQVPAGFPTIETDDHRLMTTISPAGHVRTVRMFIADMADDAMVAGTQWGADRYVPPPGAIITTTIDMLVGDQGNRVGFTSQVGDVNPSTIPGGWTIRRFYARTSNANVVFQLQDYDGDYEGAIAVDFGIGPDVGLTYNGNGEWRGNSPAFLAALEANVGGTLSIFLGAS